MSAKDLATSYLVLFQLQAMVEEVSRKMKKLLILEAALLLCTAQFFTQGYPRKNSFRKHESTETEQTHENEIKSNSYKPRKERIKNARGKAKDFLDYELDHILSDHPMSDPDGREPSRNQFVNYYQPNTGLDHMHTHPVYHDHATQIREPHLRYDYTYDNDVSSKRHGTNRRVDSYVGEMIDDENTLSHYIAPPVYENNQNRHKTHPSQDEKMLFGNSEAENANTKSFMNSLSSLLSPLSLSDSQKKSLRSPSYSEIDDFKSDVEYHGNYNVQSKHMDSDDNSWDSHRDASKHNPDSESDERDSRYSDRHETSHSSNRDDDRDNENSNEDRDSFSHDDDYRKHPPQESKDFESYDNNKEEADDDYSRYDRSNDDELGQTRSSDYHEQGDKFSSNEDRQRYEDDKYSSNDYDGPPKDDNDKEHFEKHEDDREPDRSKDSAPADSEQKPIEMMQDLSGKLHSLTKGVQSDDIASDVQKYLPHDQEQKDM